MKLNYRIEPSPYQKSRPNARAHKCGAGGLLARLVLALSVVLSGNIIARAQETGPAKADPFYRLVMSRDDKVCHALDGLYNSFASRSLADVKDPDEIMPEWESVYADEYARAGFHQPPTQVADDVTEPGYRAIGTLDDNSFYFGDVLGDGKPRFFLRISGESSSYSYDEIFIFQQGKSPRLKYLPELSPPPSDGYLLDPNSVDFFLDFYTDNPSVFPQPINSGKFIARTQKLFVTPRKLKKTFTISYQLKYWSLAKITNNEYSKTDIFSKYPPDISLNTIQYPFFYDGIAQYLDGSEYSYGHSGKYIFTARHNFSRRTSATTENLILVYSLTPQRTIDDLCYFYHSPQYRRAN